MTNAPSTVTIRFACLGLLVMSSLSFAKTFKSVAVKMELPPNWTCVQEEQDYVCQPDNLAERSEAILVVVSKMANAIDDTFPKYEEILKTPRDMRDLLGNAYKSEVKVVRQRPIKGQPWVDALHLGSEIPGFFTRYLASIKDDKIAGLLTYSIAESVYPKWSPVMDQMVDSLEIFYDPKAIADLLNSGQGSLLGSRAGMKGRMAPGMDKDTKKPGGQSDDTMAIVGGIVIFAAALGYLYWKRKQKKAAGG